MTKLEEYIEIDKSVKICRHIGTVPGFENSGHERNRVITCREDVRPEQIYNFPVEKTWLAIFIPGICIKIHPDGTWTLQPDGDN
jgi:hypothetical protein